MSMMNLQLVSFLICIPSVGEFENCSILQRKYIASK